MLVTGGDPAELRGDGIFFDHSERYAVTDEFLAVWRQLMAGEKTTFKGEHIAVENSKLLYPPVQKPYPPLYFGGSSEAGNRVAADHVDVYLTWGEPPNDVAQKIAKARALAAERGRTLSFGIRLHVIVRETSAEAWRAADSLISKLDDEAIEKAQRSFANFDSVGQKRMAALHGGRRDKLEVSPNLWAGVGLVRGGAGTALVGNPDEVAERMKEYMKLGIDRFDSMLSISASRRMLSIRRTGVPETAAEGDDRRKSRAGPSWRPVWRGDFQYRGPVASPGGQRRQLGPGEALPRRQSPIHHANDWCQSRMWAACRSCGVSHRP